VTEGDRYQIRILGWIGERWTEWFDGLSVAAERTSDDQPVTVLTGTVADQAALRGLLCKAWDLNLVLLSLTCETTARAQISAAHRRAEEGQP
jgi:hypothetical protein